MEKERFSLLLLDPGEIYFEDFSAILVTPNTTIQTYERKKIDGRLKICSKSLVFVPRDLIKPMIKIMLKDIQLLEEWKGSLNFIKSDNVFRIESKQYIEMLERNVIAPYKFCESGKFIIALNYGLISNCLAQIFQLKRASTLPAIEQADMIATIVHSRHARILFDPLWLDLYEKIELELQGNKITPLVVNPGRVVLSTKHLYFQPYNNIEMSPVIKIRINSIESIFKRRFLLRHIGLEIYYKRTNSETHQQDEDNTHIYLSFINEGERESLYCKLTENPLLKLKNTNQDVMTLQWQNGILSNYDYLNYINSLGDRTKNDLTQYPIFPWIILDYTSPTINLNDERIYRDLTRPVGALNPQRLAKLRERYDEMSDNDPKFLYGSHYSTPGFVLFYLVRLFPQYMLCLQNGRFDHPDRMFNSCINLCKNSLNDMSDFKELVPEFYDVTTGGSFLINHLGIHFGYKHDGVKVGDVELPKWATSPQHFVNTLRDALESDYVSQRLHHWIDLIFGYKQRGDEAIKANNLFYYLCYEGGVDLDQIADLNQRHTLEVQIMEFGQIPRQVFDIPHPKRKLGLPLLIEPQQIWPESYTGLSKLQLKTTFSTHKAKVNCVFIAEDGDRIVSVGHDSKMKVFSMQQNRQIRSASIGQMPLSSCVKLPGINTLIIGSYGNEINIYDLNFGKIVQTVIKHDDAITSLAWAEKRKVLCSGSSDCTVCVWNGCESASGLLKPLEYALHHFDHNSHVTCICFDRDNEHLAVGTEDGEIYVWNMNDYSLTNKFASHTTSVTAVQFSPDSQRLISSSKDKTFQVLDLSTGMNLYRRNFKAELTCLKCVAYNLFIGTMDGFVCIWDIIEVKLLAEVKVHNGAVLSLDATNDKNIIVTSGEDCLIKVWITS